ncbi:MAG: DUF4190 domain-containing protein [Anaerolineae bacterium]|nr:DUF4190 domain-containing protein [Anaerolineae bacterium]
MQTSKRINRMALISFILGLIALLSLGLYWELQTLIFSHNTDEFANRVILPIMDGSTTVRNFCALTALVSGIIALNQIKKAGQFEKRKLFAWIGIVLGSSWILFGIAVGFIFSLAKLLD